MKNLTPYYIITEFTRIVEIGAGANVETGVGTNVEIGEVGREIAAGVGGEVWVLPKMGASTEVGIGLAIAIFFLIIFIYAVITHKASSIEQSKNELEQRLDKEVPKQNGRGSIDIRYARINRGVLMRDHDNNQVNTPNRASTFIYNHNDRLGLSVLNMLQSNNASSVSVVVDGQLTKGYELAMLRSGDLLDSKKIRVNPAWLANKTRNNDISSVGTPMPLVTNDWSILTTNPTVSNVVDNRNRDVRHSMNYIN